MAKNDKILYKVIANYVYAWKNKKDADSESEAAEAIAKAEQKYQNALNKYNEASTNLENYTEEINTLTSRKNTLESNISTTNRELTEYKARATYYNRERTNALKNVNNKKAEINSIKDSIKVLSESVNEASESKDRARASYDKAQSEYNTQLNMVNKLYDDMTKAYNEYNVAREAYQRAEAESQTGTPIPEDIIIAYTTKRAVYRVSVDKYNTEKNKLERLESAVESSVEALNIAVNNLANLEERLSIEEQKLTNANEELVNLQITYDQIEINYQNAQNTYNQTLNQVKTMNNELSRVSVVLNQEKDQYYTLLNSLSPLKSNLEKANANVNSTKKKYKNTKSYSAVLYKGTVVELSGSSGWVSIRSVVVNKTAGSPKGSYILYSNTDLQPVPGNAYTESYVINYDQTNNGTVNPYEVAGDKVERETYLASVSNTTYKDYYDMVTTYKSIKTKSDYMNDINRGLSMVDIRPILGLPPQLLPLTDVRIDNPQDYSDSAFGRMYSKFILKNIPLLLLQPGSPEFLSSESKKTKKELLSGLFDGVEDIVNKVLGKKKSFGKFYNFKSNFTEYYGYVNTVLRVSAVMLGIQNEVIDGTALGDYNWLYSESGNGKNNFKRFIGPYTGCIALYCDCGTEVSDSFSNTTSQSNLASQINSVSDQARELSFFLGIGSHEASKLVGDEATAYLKDNLTNIGDEVNKLVNGSGGIFNSLLSKAQTVLTGGRLIFPEIWTDSSFGRSYSCKMKLVALYGNPLCVFLQILVPFAHIFSMVMPKDTSQGQAYTSPFVIRGWFKGRFNIDLGIITDFSFSRGSEGEWTVDGLPTVAELSFSIKDLYDGMAITNITSNDSKENTNVVSNVMELDYIANTCGININANEVVRIAITYAILFKSKVVDTFTTNIFGGIVQYFNTKINNIFGVF